MKFKTLQWSFPVAVTLHNAEEAIWMPGSAAAHAVQLPMHPPGAIKIRIALVALTALAFVVTYFSARSGPKSIWAYLTFGYIVTMLVNVFVPHVPAAFLFRGYAPGVVTALLINLPLMSFLALLALRDRWVSGWRAAAFGLGVPLGLGAFVVVLWSL